MIFHSLDKYRDIGLLILRVGLGISLFFHGYPKLEGGPELWAKLGGALGALGINFAPTFMGFMAAIAETLGGILLAVGLFTRPALFFILNTMIVATVMHMTQGDSFKVYSHALELSIVFLSLIFIGPGKYSADVWYLKRKGKL